MDALADTLTMTKDEMKRFFDELSPFIKYGKKFDRELSLKVAHRFNVFDFLRDDEHGLSNIIAHLINPSASHGQVTFFLRHFLKLVASDRNWDYLNRENIIVEREHTPFECRRRIDIYVEILGDQPFFLAIENKPYAKDQENQILDSLECLRCLSQRRGRKSDFLVIYLSPRGEAPKEYSFSRDDRSRIKWKGKI